MTSATAGNNTIIVELYTQNFLTYQQEWNSKSSDSFNENIRKSSSFPKDFTSDFIPKRNRRQSDISQSAVSHRKEIDLPRTAL